MSGRECIRVTMGGLALDGETIGSNELACHHSQTAKALSEDVTLYITVIVFGSSDEAARGLDELRDHVVNKLMFVEYSSIDEGALVRSTIKF